MVEIYWDLDGCLRDMAAVVYGHEPDSWNTRRESDGKNFLEAVDADPELLLNAPPMPYLALLKNVKNVKIATCQYPSWKSHTEAWVRNHLPQAKIFWFEGPNGRGKCEFVIEQMGAYLVEDSPNCPDYSKIILIDHPYNRDIKAACRVHNVKQMREVMDIIATKTLLSGLVDLMVR